MSIASQMAFQNPWWADPSSIGNDEKVVMAMSSKPKFIPRLPYSSSLIMVPRQSGKTTAMKLAIKELLESGVDPSAVFTFLATTLGIRMT
ncbi:hypothetical protein PQ610_02210 [Tardisphaera miroshnichenkoae]